ncbi:MAG TPA: hypothetical protein VHQ86_00490, partial [Candidatus Saccharimonadia bacterium]|nr:hypothetical protein [Candidatus Saccharimonadia bacterium]
EFADNMRPVLDVAQNDEERASLIVLFMNAQDMAGRAIDRYQQPPADGSGWYSAEELEHFPVDEESMAEMLEPHLSPIRQAFLEDVEQRLGGDASVHMLAKALTSDNRIWEAHNHKVLKLPRDADPSMPPEPEGIKADRLEAVRALYALRERHPNVAYQILEIERSTADHHGVEVQAHLSIDTLDALVQREDRPDFDQVMGYLEDGMRGAQFLVAHGLRLTDLTPTNIAIDRATGRGMLFDFDTLRTADTAIVGYSTVEAHWPPERTPDPSEFASVIDYLAQMQQIRGPITEAEMVYEFGMTMGDLARTYEQAANQNLVGLVEAMTQQDPATRPTLAEAIAALGQLRAS